MFSRFCEQIFLTEQICAPTPGWLHYGTCMEQEEKHVQNHFFTHKHTYVFTELTQTGN